jgi:hypothetical protein
MSEENPDPQAESSVVTETQEGHQEEAHVAQEQHSAEEQQEEKHVPLSVVQKERRKRQQLQQELELYKQQHQQPQEEDYSKYESVTREDLGKSQQELLRAVDERNWSSQNPEKAAYVETELEEFLQKRPNLAAAIQNAPNRLQEAYELMSALSARKAKPKASQPSREAPQSPGTVPKAAALNETVDVMNMSDSDFRNWRQSKRKRR